MKFYITEETKQELEYKITELEAKVKGKPREFVYKQVLQLEIFKEILKSSIVLPVEESFEENNVVITEKRWMFNNYPNGLIINKKI